MLAELKHLAESSPDSIKSLQMFGLQEGLKQTGILRIPYRPD